MVLYRLPISNVVAFTMKGCIINKGTIHKQIHVAIQKYKQLEEHLTTS